MTIIELDWFKRESEKGDIFTTDCENTPTTDPFILKKRWRTTNQSFDGWVVAEYLGLEPIDLRLIDACLHCPLLAQHYKVSPSLSIFL